MCFNSSLLWAVFLFIWLKFIKKQLFTYQDREFIFSTLPVTFSTVLISFCFSFSLWITSSRLGETINWLLKTVVNLLWIGKKTFESKMYTSTMKCVAFVVLCVLNKEKFSHFMPQKPLEFLSRQTMPLASGTSCVPLCETSSQILRQVLNLYFHIMKGVLP